MEFPQEQNDQAIEIIKSADERLDPETFESTEDAKIFVDWCLAGSYGTEGVEQWWNRPRKKLDGQTPAEAWNSKPNSVIELAESLTGPKLDETSY